jgi:hypothetical protein
VRNNFVITVISFAICLTCYLESPNHLQASLLALSSACVGMDVGLWVGSNR